MDESNYIRMNHYRREIEGFLELGMPLHALELVRNLESRLIPLDISVLYLKGECLRNLEYHREAWEVLEKVASLCPGNIFVLVSLAWCQKRVGRIDLACESVREALSFDPDNALLHFNLSCYYSLLGEKRKAIEHLQKALSLDPTYQMMIPDEPDFNPIRQDVDFPSLETFRTPPESIMPVQQFNKAKRV